MNLRAPTDDSPVVREAFAGIERFRIYQHERFPLVAHGPLIAFNLSDVFEYL